MATARQRRHRRPRHRDALPRTHRPNQLHDRTVCADSNLRTALARRLQDRPRRGRPSPRQGVGLRRPHSFPGPAGLSLPLAERTTRSRDWLFAIDAFFL